MKRIATVLALAAGCMNEAALDPMEPEPPPVEPELQPVDPVVVEIPAIETPVCEGTFALDSEIDMTASAVLPETVHGYLETLEAFREDPAATLFALLADAGVPLVDELLGALPGVLEDALFAAIDDYIDDALLEGTPIGAVIDHIVAMGEAVLASFRMDSELSFPAGGGPGTHRVRALRFAIDGAVVSVPVEAVPDPAAIFEAPVEVEVIPGVAGEASLVVGDHAFGLAYGELALAAIEQGSVAAFGADLRGVLGALVDCPALAADVADRCVLGACVGHEAELAALCEAGLDLLVEEATGRLAALRFDALRLSRGEALLSDECAIHDGVWDATLDVGMGARSVPARFEGSR